MAFIQSVVLVRFLIRIKGDLRIGVLYAVQIVTLLLANLWFVILGYINKINLTYAKVWTQVT